MIDKHDYRDRFDKDAVARIPTPLLSETGKIHRQAEKEMRAGRHKSIDRGESDHFCGAHARDRCFRHHICELKPKLPRFGIVTLLQEEDE